MERFGIEVESDSIVSLFCNNRMDSAIVNCENALFFICLSSVTPQQAARDVSLMVLLESSN